MKIIDGKPFECITCGECCRWEGDVYLTPEDIARLGEYLHLETSDFLDKYTETGKTLANKPGTSECIFLNKNICTVWGAKPEQCSKYPLKFTEKCPGFKVSRSNCMNEYQTAVKMAKERMAQTEYPIQATMNNLYKYLKITSKYASIATMAIEAGIDSYLSGNTIKVASLDDIFSFDRVNSNHLIHKATKDLWQINNDKDGNVQITRPFDNTGEPIKG